MLACHCLNKDFWEAFPDHKRGSVALAALSRFYFLSFARTTDFPVRRLTTRLLPAMPLPCGAPDRRIASGVEACPGCVHARRRLLGAWEQQRRLSLRESGAFGRANDRQARRLFFPPSLAPGIHAGEGDRRAMEG